MREKKQNQKNRKKSAWKDVIVKTFMLKPSRSRSPMDGPVNGGCPEVPQSMLLLLEHAVHRCQLSINNSEAVSGKGGRKHLAIKRLQADGMCCPIFPPPLPLLLQHHDIRGSPWCEL